MPFEIREKGLKKYPHFDMPIPADELLSIVTDPEKVRRNAFFPFLQYTKQYQPFRDRPNKPDPKRRLIRYASRRDAAIFSYYRYLLAERYEARLVEFGIQDCPTAYRKIPKGQADTTGKCNIDFAHDVFEEIAKQKDCVVITLDISKFFECIDHHRLYQVWCELLGVDRLPPDHLAVFKAITRYVVVDRGAVYERLGFIKEVSLDGESARKEYARPFHKMPKQLCSPQTFRQKIMGKDPSYASLCEPNINDYGIPQGAPISDLLANAYLMEFDQAISDYSKSVSGKYWRYSDDIVLVLPVDDGQGLAARDFVIASIKEVGDQLTIKKNKTPIVRYSNVGDVDCQFELIEGGVGRNGLEYLGFRFDGKNIYIRDSTMSNFYRKITRRARKQARQHFARFPGKTREWLLESFDFSDFEKRYGRVHDFESLATRTGWTFWTYVKRAADQFGEKGRRMYRQVRRYRSYIEFSVAKEIDRQLGLVGAAADPNTNSPSRSALP